MRRLIGFAALTVLYAAISLAQTNTAAVSAAYLKVWEAPEVQTRIAEGIRSNRMAEGCLRLAAKPGTEVTVEQTRHAFLFGGNSFLFGDLKTPEKNKRYAETFGTLFNAATVAFYWKTLEPEPGKPRFVEGSSYEYRRPPPDPVVTYLESRGINMNGHTIIYGMRRWGHPTWLPEDRKAMEPIFERHVKELAERYGSRVQRWDVVNESIDQANRGLMPDDYTYKTYAWAAKYFPASVRFGINDCDIHWGLSRHNRYVEIARDLIDRGTRVDTVGVQMHIFDPKESQRIANGADILTPVKNYAVLDCLKGAGRPIHISEVTISAPEDTDAGKAVQATLARNLYRLWFSYPQVMGITWWNMVDGGAAPGEPSLSGLYDTNMNPKPVYQALDELINREWKTRLTVKAEAGKPVTFRGFKGRYHVTWTDAAGAAKSAGFDLSKDGDGIQPTTPSALHAQQARPSPEWLTRGVMYQVWLRAFTPEGTLRAATQRLQHVADTGATIVYLSPVYLQDDDMRCEFWSERQKKCGLNNPRNPYRIKDYNAIDPEYGTEDDLRAFIAEAHRLGLHVLMDLVYFHCGPTSVLMAHPDYFKKDKNGKISTGEWHFPVLNFDNPALREYLWANMAHWIKDFNVDGFRCDVADAVPLDFWEQARERLTTLRSDLVILAEGERETDPLAAFDINYNFTWYRTSCAVFAGKKPASALRTLWTKMAQVRPQGSRFIRFTENHDFANDTGTNRVEKLWGTRGAAAMLVVNFTLDGVPFLYNGQEIADTAPHSIYGRWPVAWETAATPTGQARFAFCQKLCALRHAERALTQGSVIWLDNDAPDAVVSFIRHTDTAETLSVVNLSDRKLSVQVDRFATMEPLLADGAQIVSAGGKLTFDLAPYGYFVGKAR